MHNTPNSLPYIGLDFVGLGYMPTNTATFVINWAVFLKPIRQKQETYLLACIHAMNIVIEFLDLQSIANHQLLQGF